MSTEEIYQSEWYLANKARQNATHDLGLQIIELAGHLNAANYRLLKLIFEFDCRKGWGGDGATQSCAHWLNWKCGIDIGAAREKVRTAHALATLPKIARAMQRGELSYSKVRAITRVACSGTEDYFLQLALHGTASHVEKLVRYYRRCKESEELSREERQRANRTVGWFFDHDGSFVMKARLPAEVGKLFLKAMEAAREEIPMAGVSAEMPPQAHPLAHQNPDHRMRRADALALLAESFLAHGPAAMNGGDRHQLVVHVDAETLRDSTPGQCELEEGPAIAAETARRLACDCSVVPIIENAQGEPLNVGRKTRSIPPALRRALNARDRGCRFPGCCNTRYVDGHHIKHWAHGGETKLSNLVSLCRFHHRQVHEGNIVVQVLDDGAIRFVRPDGECFDSTLPGYTQPIPDWQQLVVTHEEEGLHIDRKTAATRWRGEVIDYSLAIEVLLQRCRKGKRVSAESYDSTLM